MFFLQPVEELLEIKPTPTPPIFRINQTINTVQYSQTSQVTCSMVYIIGHYPFRNQYISHIFFKYRHNVVISELDVSTFKLNICENVTTEFMEQIYEPCKQILNKYTVPVIYGKRRVIVWSGICNTIYLTRFWPNIYLQQDDVTLTTRTGKVYPVSKWVGK